MLKKDKRLALYKNLEIDKSNNNLKIRKIYQDWAKLYDHDNDDLLGTVSQPTSVNILKKLTKKHDLKIIDIGCGTGLVGKFLNINGYINYDGLDISKEMLAIAKKRGYRNLKVGSLQGILPYDDRYYDITFCVGVFTHGHVGPDGLDELIRITKYGGHIIFTINEGVYEEYQFDKKISILEKERFIKIISFEKKQYMIKKNVMGYYCLAKII